MSKLNKSQEHTSSSNNDQTAQTSEPDQLSPEMMSSITKLAEKLRDEIATKKLPPKAIDTVKKPEDLKEAMETISTLCSGKDVYFSVILNLSEFIEKLIYVQLLRNQVTPDDTLQEAAKLFTEVEAISEGWLSNSTTFAYGCILADADFIPEVVRGCFGGYSGM